MMLKLITCALLLSVCAACSGNSPTSNTPTNNAPTSNAPPDAALATQPDARPTPAEIVRARAAAVTLPQGGAGTTEVQLDIAAGYHINANPASFPYLRATELEVVPQAGLTPGQPTYPAPLTRKFSFAPEPLAVYEGTTTIKLPLRAAGSAAKGAQTLPARVRVQACDEEKCFPPTTITTTIPVTIN